MNNFCRQVIWLSGMPRSGTTWLSQIFASSPQVRLKFCPLFSYEFKNALDEKSTSKDWLSFFNDVYNTSSPYMDQEHLKNDGLVPDFAEKKPNPDFLLIKSNRFHNLIPCLFKNVPCAKVIHLVRHPAATIHSWLSNPTEFPADANPLREWRSGTCRKTGVGEFWGFDDWKAVTLQALEMERVYPNRMRILRYEELTKYTFKETETLFDFIGLSICRSTKDFINESRSRHDPNKRSVYKKPSPDAAWRLGLPKSIINSIEADLAGKPQERFTKELS
jgi:hypothetical protein